MTLFAVVQVYLKSLMMSHMGFARISKSVYNHTKPLVTHFHLGIQTASPVPLGCKKFNIKRSINSPYNLQHSWLVRCGRQLAGDIVRIG